ncbi:hypothetical protein EJ07DRAFT_175005 [Lizonia empirigonia]|nr:hypothetical protein EJ07DRAFT_175005 [Lizonia empirigonia]
MDPSDAIPQVTQNVSEELCIDDRVPVFHGTLDSDVGIGYLDIVLGKITGGKSMDPVLYERTKASFDLNMDAIWNLGEVADNIRECSADTLTPDIIISRIWSNSHPQLARELEQFVMATQDSHTGGQSISLNEASDYGMDTTGSHDHVTMIHAEKDDSISLV